MDGSSIYNVTKYEINIIIGKLMKVTRTIDKGRENNSCKYINNQDEKDPITKK